MFSLTPVVKILLIINVALFLISRLLFSQYGVDLTNMLGLFHFESPYFYPYQILTHMFLHDISSFGHIFGNMLGLAIFGPLLERAMNSKRFLIMYMVAGIGASLLYSGINFWEVEQAKIERDSYLENPSPGALKDYMQDISPALYRENIDFMDAYFSNPEKEAYVQESKRFVEGTSGKMIERMLRTPMVGASGAIFGIIMFFALLFPNLRLMLLFPPIPIKAKYLVLFYALYELYGIYQKSPNDNVAHFAHVGGMLFAFILFKLWKMRRLH